MSDANETLAAARAAFDAGDNERALELCRRVLADSPANARALGASARCLTALGRHDEAVDAARSAVAAEPAQPFGHIALVVALYTAERNADAVAAVDAAAAAKLSDAERAGLLVLAAYAAIALERLEDAERLAARAVELGGADPSTHAALASALGAQRKMGPALDRIDRAIALDPDNTSLRDRRAALAEGVEMLERSLKKVTATNAEAPSVEGWSEIGDILELLGRHEDAAQALAKAHELQALGTRKIEKS